MRKIIIVYLLIIFWNTEYIISQELTINQIENILINSQENIDDPDLNIIKYNYELYSINQDSALVEIDNNYYLENNFTYIYKEINGSKINAKNWIYYIFSYVDLQYRWYQFPIIKYYTMYDNYIKIKMNLTKNGYEQIAVNHQLDKIIYNYRKEYTYKSKDINGKILTTEKKIIDLKIDVNQKNPTSEGVMLSFEIVQQ